MIMALSFIILPHNQLSSCVAVIIDHIFDLGSQRKSLVPICDRDKILQCHILSLILFWVALVILV